MDQIKVNHGANVVPDKPRVGIPKSLKPNKILMGIVSLVVVVIVIVAVWVIAANVSGSPISTINKSEYQAVFLTNGQVYFGKITTINTNYMKIIDIYYLQAQQNPQNASTSSSQKLALVKLGGEIHAPEDEMFIARPQILFWENLKSSGQVVQAILHNQGT